MSHRSYRSMNSMFQVNRRDFLKTGSIAGAGLLLGGPILGTPSLWAQDKEKEAAPSKPKTNIDEVIKIPRTKTSIPGPFPGKVVEVHNEKAMVGDATSAEVVKEMFGSGLRKLTGVDAKASFERLFTKEDIVGIKVNPVGSGLISTRLELVDAIIDWLASNGVKRSNIIIWDRFDYMLPDAGFTRERYPEVGIEGLQTMDESAASGESTDDSKWLDKAGKHISASNFDDNVYYWADIDAPQDKPYLNQHVVNSKLSNFGKLVTQKLTKIINVPVLKNTGNGISVATKNLGYAAICNTGRLHRPLFFDVCTEVLAFPAIRDKLVLNVVDGLRAQYDGGPMPAAQFTYVNNVLYLSTDPFALDMICHNAILAKRKSMNVAVNEHPMFTDYLRYGEKLGLGIADPTKIEHVRI